MTIELDDRRAELLELRERVLRAAQDIVEDDTEDGELSSAAGDQHIADHASDMLDREVDESLEENAEVIVREIDDALARIEDGTYGTCVRCGQPIPDERLAAVPYAVLCVPCKRGRGARLSEPARAEPRRAQLEVRVGSATNALQPIPGASRSLAAGAGPVGRARRSSRSPRRSPTS